MAINAKNKVILAFFNHCWGYLFLSSQAWEWGHFIHGDKGAVELKNSEVVHIMEDKEIYSVYELMGV